MEVMLSVDRYAIMECVSQQTKEFRFAEMYFLLKEHDPERWRAKDVKVTMEWLADMGLVRKKLVKAAPGQIWLFYQSRFDHDFLLSRVKQAGGEYDAESTVYMCRGVAEKMRCIYACIKEKYSRDSGKLSYKFPFV